MTLLTIVQDVTDVLGIPKPTSVVGNNDAQIRQILALANLEGQSQARDYPWQSLIKITTFTTTATQEQTDSSLTDVTDINWHITRTWWDTDQTVRVFGPLKPRTWAFKDAVATAGPYAEFRIRNNKVFLLPAPAAGNTISFEYVSKNWCESSGGTGQDKWAADTDVGILDEYLMTLGLIYRWLRAKRLSYGEEFRDYMDQVVLAQARDGGGNEVISITEDDVREFGTRVPEGDWLL